MFKYNVFYPQNYKDSNEFNRNHHGVSVCVVFVWEEIGAPLEIPTCWTFV